MKTPEISAGRLMAGKHGLVMGIANDHSIAWGIARAVHAQGARLALTYQGDVFAKRVEPLAAAVDAARILPCDVAEPASLDAVFDAITSEWGGLEFRRPCRRLLRQGGAKGPVRRHVGGKLPAHDGHFLLLFHRGGAPGRDADAGRRAAS